MTVNYIPPAQLFIGPHDYVVDHTHAYLQKILCVQGGCGSCGVCFSIRMHQHYALLWFSSSKPYTRELLEDIFSTITLALEKNANFFFVIEQAHTLTTATANSLLKSIEEPPTGYHFIFLTDRPMQVIETIVSRCIMHTISHTSADEIISSALYPFFTAIEKPNPLLFMAELERNGINEQESMVLLDAIFLFWFKKYAHEVRELGKLESDTQKKITCIQQALEQPLMPGSSKLFWRNVFMQLHEG